MANLGLVDTAAQAKAVGNEKSAKVIADCFENAEQLTERMRFHWEVWEGATKRFSRFATVVAIMSVLSYVINLGYWTNISVFNNAFSMTYLDSNRLSTLRVATSVANGFLIIALVSSWLDTMRHRVPDDFEPLVHNNILRGRDLKKPGQLFQMAVLGLVFISMSMGLAQMILSHPSPAAIIEITRLSLSASQNYVPQVQFRALSREVQIVAKYKKNNPYFKGENSSIKVLEPTQVVSPIHAVSMPLYEGMSVLIQQKDAKGNWQTTYYHEGKELTKRLEQHTQFTE